MHIIYQECGKTDKLCDSILCDEYWECKNIKTRILVDALPEFGVKKKRGKVKKNEGRVKGR